VRYDAAGGGSGRGEKCLFLLDEFYSLGRIDEIAKAAGLMPSYGVHLWPFLQDLGQLQKLYGKEGMETFFGNSDAQIFFGNSDSLTLDYVSKQIGTLRPEEIYDTPPHLQNRSTFWDSKFMESEKDAKERWSREDENTRRNYQHQMGLAGTPRIPPDQLKKLIAKRNGEPVANSMVMFSANGDTYNLAVQPYFQTPAAPSGRKKRRKKTTQQGDEARSRVPLIFAMIAALIAATLALPHLVSYLTQYLTAYMPRDISKAVVVVGLCIAALHGYSWTFRKRKRLPVRLIGLFFWFGIVWQGVYLSNDHITRSSFMFGPYVGLVDKYWR